MKAQMKTGLIALYDEALPKERLALSQDDREELDNFLSSIEGKVVSLVFTGVDAFEEKDNNIWLPPSLWDEIFSANVPSDLSLLAFGIPPAREAESAGGMPKVPKGQGLGRLARSAGLSFL